jgi:hypothetical protein
MRAMIAVALLGLSSSAAFAGPSDFASRRFGDYSQSARPEVRRESRQRNTPYALTGERPQRRVLQFRDVPRGRGQTESQAFWVWVAE